jgi:hypothetical protein
MSGPAGDLVWRASGDRMLRRVTMSAGRGGAVLGFCETQRAAGGEPHFRFLCRAAVRSLDGPGPCDSRFGSRAVIASSNWCQPLTPRQPTEFLQVRELAERARCRRLYFLKPTQRRGQKLSGSYSNRTLRAPVPACIELAHTSKLCYYN